MRAGDQANAASSTLVGAGALVFGLLAIGCQRGLQHIDKRVDAMVVDTSADLGPDAYPPRTTLPDENIRISRQSPAASEQPGTINPPAADLTYQAIDEADEVLARLNAYSSLPENALAIDLPFALAYAAKHAREYQFAEEEYVLAALRLLIERHLWGPRFFNDTSALVTSVGEDGTFDSALRLVNEFRVTQRLPYGGEVSARALAAATEDLHQRVAGEDVQNATVILEANLPLLRGAGLAARESRIQAERDLIYAARDFEEFRRDFFFDVAQDFLNLIVAQSAVENAQRQFAGLQLVADRERALYEAGRTPIFQKALAEQSAVAALDDLNERRESYTLSVDRFKVRLGIQVDQAVQIVRSGYDLPPPQVDMNTAVQQALMYRLDLQTQRDVVEDARRGVEVARNDVLPDLDLTGSAAIITDPDRRRGGLGFDPGYSDFAAGITFGLPLDREIERIGIRTSQIQLERSRRELERQRDNATVSVRSAVRDIDRARYTLEIQERSVATGEQRVASIEAAPDRATARDASEANNELARARDRRDAAARDLQVAILRYLLETGQLRVDHKGHLLPLPGMPEQIIVTDQAPPAQAPPGLPPANNIAPPLPQEGNP
jgi:outer membrane protein TolC